MLKARHSPLQVEIPSFMREGIVERRMRWVGKVGKVGERGFILGVLLLGLVIWWAMGRWFVVWFGGEV